MIVATVVTVAVIDLVWNRPHLALLRTRNLGSGRRRRHHHLDGRVEEQRRAEVGALDKLLQRRLLLVVKVAELCARGRKETRHTRGGQCERNKSVLNAEDCTERIL
jgi:hypothetical protein